MSERLQCAECSGLCSQEDAGAKGKLPSYCPLIKKRKLFFAG